MNHLPARCWRLDPYASGRRLRSVSSVSSVATFLSDHPLPTQLSRQVFVDEGGVIGRQLGPIGPLRALGIQVVGIELSHPGEHLSIVLVEKLLVLLFAVPGIKRVIANHAQ